MTTKQKTPWTTEQWALRVAHLDAELALAEAQRDELLAALKKAKPIVGAATAAASNEIRPLRQKVYDAIAAAIAKAEGRQA